MDAVALGRAVHHLRWARNARTRVKWVPSHKGQGNYWVPGEWKYTPRKPYRTDEEISELLHISVEELRDAHAAYVKSRKPPSRAECARMVWEYLRAHDRWPRPNQFIKRNGLPSRTAMEHYEYWSLLRAVAVRYKMKPEWILSQQNQTIRRNLITKYGYQYILQGQAPVQQDDYGSLYRIPTPSGQEEIVLVEVVNTTPEPDGSFAHYFLRVPPNTASARAAVQWTFQTPGLEIVASS
jgi:hypothetical protein